MSDDELLSKRDLLRRGVKRAGEAGVVAAEFALEDMANRFVPAVQRPPGALAEMHFLMACTRCGECSKACPVGAIMTLGDQAGLAAGTPFLNVNDYKPCVMCSHAPCMPACPTDALSIIPIADAVLGTAELSRDTCTAWTGEAACRRCFNACPVRDTAMVIDEGGRPYIDPRHCVGCGVCRSACPTDPKSIRIKPPPRF